MSDNSKPKPNDLSATIAEEIRSAIINGDLIVDARLPSEAELAQTFSVSRPTVREALKRLAAQSLIRTQRGATGGAFVNRLSYADAREQHVTTSTLLLTMNDVSFAAACEARFALEQACVPLACSRRTTALLDQMGQEISLQTQEDMSHEDFCASDVRFHRLFVDCTQNAVLSYQLSGAVEAMQPLMNMLTYNRRSRDGIIHQHKDILKGLKNKEVSLVSAALNQLCSDTLHLARTSTKRVEQASQKNTSEP